MGIRVVTDSTSYIPKNIRESLGIEVVSLSVIFNGQGYREMDLTNDEFFKMMNESEEIPTSSQPNIGEVKETFQNIINQGDKIVGIFISSDMSGTYQSAKMIKDMILEENENAQIEIIDSRSNCMQMGYAVIEAAKAAKSGEDILEVANKAKSVISNSRFLFIPETLKYLKKGGRIGGAAALLGNILKIIPILTVTDGKTTVFQKVRTRKKAINTMINQMFEDIHEKDFCHITVHHINCEDDGIILKEQIEEKLRVNGLKGDVIVQPIGPIIGLHVGPGSIGIAYYTKG